jgi:hypothetical protein
MVVWDLNLAFGNARHNEGYLTTTWVYRLNSVLYRHDDYMIPLWWYRLDKDPWYTNLRMERWAEWREANVREDRIMATVDSLVNEVTCCGAVDRNSQAWPRWDEWLWPNYYVSTDYADEIAYLKQWISDRIAWMDEHLGYHPVISVRGDVNSDGEVSVSDVTLLITYLMTEDSASIDLNAADCSQDGTVNIGDATILINFLMNGHWPDE